MADERRYLDDEIAEIFETAATPRASRGVSRTHGLTLEELQAIGREVGVPPERIADAAKAIERRRQTPVRRRFLGMPLSAGRIIDLPRAPTDREWDVLLAELRRTFGAQGRDSSRGSTREWVNGNLHACIEPTATGYRLRLGTVKGDAGGVNGLGISGVLSAAILAGAPLLSGAPLDIVGPAFLGLGGAAALLYNYVRLPQWARRRDEQMEYIAGRAAELITGGGPPTDT